VHEAIQGKDLLDGTTLCVPNSAKSLDTSSGINGLRLAFAESVFFDDVDPEVESAVRDTKEIFSSLGALINGIEIPEVSEADSISDRYHEMSVEAYSVNKDLFEKHPNEIDVVMTWILDGNDVTTQRFYDLIRKRYELSNQVAERLKDVDALLVPTTQITAHPLSEVDGDAQTYYGYMDKYSRNTSLGNYLKLCGISVCCGFSSEGLPIGLMIYAKPFEEETVFRVASAFESSTNWSDQHPDLSWIEN
jgi:aspartyl-tRNA(Asn)/glutamyl-tRNA(Gln) amidotransferase subunit A